MQETLQILKALSDGTRLEMLRMLLGRNYCASALAVVLGVTKSAVSQHLKVLREAGLLSGTRHGHYLHYDVDRARLLQLAGKLSALAGQERLACEGMPAATPVADGAGCGCGVGRNRQGGGSETGCCATRTVEYERKLPLA